MFGPARPLSRFQHAIGVDFSFKPRHEGSSCGSSVFRWVVNPRVEQVCGHFRPQYSLVVIGRRPSHQMLQGSAQLFDELRDRFSSAPSQGLILVGRRSGQGWPKATAKRQGLDGEKPGVASLAAKDGLGLLRYVLEPVTQPHAAVCFTSTLIGSAGSIAGEHLSASPPGKPHEILFLPAIG